MPRPFQKAVIAMLLAAPSTLQKKWREGKSGEFDAELARLGFSTDAIADAKKAAEKLTLPTFNEAADQLKVYLWDGGEPHPPDTDAAEMAATARKRDGE
jgi:hypothetical protein